jgi:hypothetical protein
MTAGWIAEATSTTLLVAAAGAAASYVVGTVLTDALGLAPNSTADTQRGLTVNTSGQTDPLPVLYGRSLVAGTRAIIGTNGSDNKQLHIIIIHCEGEVSDVSERILYADGVVYTDQKFKNTITWAFHSGSDIQTADTALIAENIGWTAADMLKGVCYSYIKLQYDAEVYSSIPVFTAKLYGRVIYDPRNGSWTPSSNPALCLWDYLTNTRYGRGLPVSMLDNQSFIDAANECDLIVDSNQGGGLWGWLDWWAHTNHTCNGLISPDDTLLDNTRKILATCRGMLRFSARGYSLIVDKARVPVFDFNAGNIIGGWGISLGGKRTRLNKVVAAWVNPEDEYQADLLPVESATFKAEDGGVTLETRLEMPLTTNVLEASILAQQHLRQSRFGISVSFTAMLEGTVCEVGDVCTITHATPGWTAKPFIVTNIKLLSSDEIEVQCREYDDSIYAATPLTAPRTTYTTLLPDPNTVTAVPTYTLTSGTDTLQLNADGTITSRIKMSWTPPTEIYIDSGQLEIQYRPDGYTFWVSGYTNSKTGEYYLSPVIDNQVYDVQARYVNEFGRVGSFSTALHQVIGKRAPPSNITGFVAALNSDRIQLSWNPITDVDLAEYEIREGVTWESAVVVGKTRSTLIKVIPAYSGSKAWLIKAIDTTGNYSVTASSTTFAITASPAPVVRVQVIDNNVLLSWSSVQGTLPTRTYQIRRGADWASGEVVGTKDGLFTSVLEPISGLYTYWVAAIDLAGNIGTASSVTTTVNEPPDYQLHTTQLSLWTGTKTNCISTLGKLYLPANTNRSWSQHFALNGWATIQDQITAGYPIYIQPVMLTGSYIEVVDFGATLPAFKASVVPQITYYSGANPLLFQLSASLDGVTYSTPIDGTSGYFTNFHYLKISITASNTSTAMFAEIAQMEIKLEAKRINWGGKVVCNAADIGGTICYLTKDGTSTGTLVFTDVLSLTPGATGAASVTPVFDFVDVPNPTFFRAYLFNASGARTSGTVYYSAIGI